MKRDMDVIRKIVLASANSDGAITEVPGIERHVFGFHAQLLEEAGLAKCFIHESSDGPDIGVDLAVVQRLTWNGCEFADAIKDQGIWDKAKAVVVKPAAAWTFGLLLEYIKLEVREKLGLNTN